jgi:transforming growth factor-beta-induced protein
MVSLILAACAPAATPAAPTSIPVTDPTATTAPSEAPAPTATAPEPTATLEPTGAPLTIVDIAAADDRFETLVAAVQAAGLVETLQGEGPFTVFAPTDDAFAALPEGTLDELLKPENKQQLVDILTYHVVPGKVMAADVAGLTEATTVQGGNVSITTDMNKVFVNDAQVVLTDIEAANGVIHVIDSVILPEAAASAEAETALDIVDTAAADERFSTLVAAIQAAGLVDTLKGEGPFTVFAPTNDAFAKLPAGTLDTLLMPENKQQLIDILTYHVVPGSVKAAEVVELGQAETVLGQPVQIRVEGEQVYINDAQVMITDIETSNGVIHVIDAVILPAQ